MRIHGMKILCKRSWVQRCSCMSSGIDRFYLDLLWAVKKECALEVGCGGLWNLWLQTKNIFTLWSEVGASIGKSYLIQLINVSCADCSRINPRAWGDYLSTQVSWLIVWWLAIGVCSVHLVDKLVLVFSTSLWLG